MNVPQIAMDGGHGFSASHGGAHTPYENCPSPMHVRPCWQLSCVSHGCHKLPSLIDGPQSDGHTQIHASGSQNMPSPHSVEFTQGVWQTVCCGSHTNSNIPTSAGHGGHSSNMGIKLQSGAHTLPAGVGQHFAPSSHVHAGVHGPLIFPTSPHMPGPVSPTIGPVVVEVDPPVLPAVVPPVVVAAGRSGVTVVVGNVLELPSDDPTTGGCAGGSKHAASNTAAAKNKGLLIF